MDLRMPWLGGIEATREILSENPHVGILVVTMIEDDASVFAAMRAAARGYLLKGADKDEMLLTILGYIPGIVHAVWVIAKY
jgi:DNA-binding NarL/FixJ family response regulator